MSLAFAFCTKFYAPERSRGFYMPHELTTSVHSCMVAVDNDGCRPLTTHQTQKYLLITTCSALYMGCSDVSEFEHIYGQILTTPSCVYGRLFTWMVDFNALVVWKTFRPIDICVSIKSSLCALTAAYTKFRRMIWWMIWSCGHRSRSPMCRLLLPHRNAGRQLGKSWKQLLWFPGGSSHYRCWSAILVTTAMTQPSPLLSPSSSDFCPLPFKRGPGGITMGKLWN